MPSPTNTFLKWVRLTLLLEALIVGFSVSLYFSAVLLCAPVVLPSPTHDWLLLMFPAGGTIGLFLGIRYRNTIWIHIVSVFLALCVVALLALLWISSTRETFGLAEGLGKLLSLMLFVVVVGTAAVSLPIAAIAASIVAVHQGRVDSSGLPSIPAKVDTKV